MKTNHIKIAVILTLTFAALGFITFKADTIMHVKAGDDTLAADYKKNCAACHTAKAEKFYDPAKNDEHHIEVILKGKKGEKPPYMPGFEAKGMTAEQAKAYAEYMRKLRTPEDANKANTNTARR